MRNTRFEGFGGFERFERFEGGKRFADGSRR